jgi:hypothetical protein
MAGATVRKKKRGEEEEDNMGIFVISRCNPR